MHRSTSILGVVLTAVVLATAAASAAGPAATTAAAVPAAAPATTPADSAAAPAATAPPAAAFDADRATQAYIAQLSPAARARSDAYFEGGYWLLIWDLVVSLVVAWIFLRSKLLVNTRDWTERLTRFKWLQTAICVAIYLLVSSLLTLPWSVYEGYHREHQYNMSNQTLSAFLIDEAKGLGIALILGTLALTVIYAVLRKAPRTWWLWGSLVAVGFAMFAAAVAPVYLEPVFNKFKPLPESELKQQVLSMARASGIPATDVYEFDASKQTKRMSAHVSGLLGTTQISMNDNLMTRGSHEEILAVLGHEMGHYVLNHVYKGIVFIGIIIVVGFAFLKWSFAKMQGGHGASWGIRDIADVAGLPLLVALFSVYGFLITPIQNTITRTMEAEADVFGINASRQPDGFAQAAMHLSEYRKMEPGPIEEYVFYDHPSGWHRIHRVMVWKAEHLQDADIVAYDAAHPDRPEAH